VACVSTVEVIVGGPAGGFGFELPPPQAARNKQSKSAKLDNAVILDALIVSPVNVPLVCFEQLEQLGISRRLRSELAGQLERRRHFSSRHLRGLSPYRS
jgi:hypothetical protein